MAHLTVVHFAFESYSIDIWTRSHVTRSSNDYLLFAMSSIRIQINLAVKTINRTIKFGQKWPTLFFTDQKFISWFHKHQVPIIWFGPHGKMKFHECLLMWEIRVEGWFKSTSRFWVLNELYQAVRDKVAIDFQGFRLYMLAQICFDFTKQKRLNSNARIPIPSRYPICFF